MELKQQNLKFHRIPRNFVHIQSSMEFHGILWNFFEFPWNFMELDKFEIKKNIFLNIVVGVLLMIICYLANISQERYILHGFQYRNLYFEQPSVNENDRRSAKMTGCSLVSAKLNAMH